MYITSQTKNDRYIITISSMVSSEQFRDHDTLTKNIGISTPHSEYVSRRRAFNRGSAIIYCNQHLLNTFVTLTYKKQHQNYNQILNDLKNNFSRRKISYIGVVEKHKSGNYHIHLLTSNLPNIVSLRKNKYSWSDWKKGFSDVKFISGTDDKFRIERYIFKYMMKSEKIGGRYILKSRDLTILRFNYPYGTLPKPYLDNRDIDFKTINTYNIYINKSNTIVKEYYGKKTS